MNSLEDALVVQFTRFWLALTFFQASQTDRLLMPNDFGNVPGLVLDFSDLIRAASQDT
jgi:hypothetical protein